MWFEIVNYCLRLYQFFCSLTEEGGILKPLKMLNIFFTMAHNQLSDSMMWRVSCPFNSLPWLPWNSQFRLHYSSSARILTKCMPKFLILALYHFFSTLDAHYQCACLLFSGFVEWFSLMFCVKKYDNVIIAVYTSLNYGCDLFTHVRLNVYRQTLKNQCSNRIGLWKMCYETV